MNKKEMKLVESYFNKSKRQIEIYDFDKSKIDSRKLIVFYAKILTAKIYIPKYIEVKKIDMDHKELIFAITVSNTVNILYLDGELID